GSIECLTGIEFLWPCHFFSRSLMRHPITQIAGFRKLKMNRRVKMKDKSVDYFLSLPYTFEIIRSEEDGWVIKVKELPGCMTQADKWEDIPNLIQEAMHGWIEVALEFGDPIPEPQAIPANQ
ncbi:MAG: type II toxin-antitoxin system HicB family antitoxin, partial [Chloroflexota bacterium]